MSKSEKHNPARQRRGRAEEVECTRNREVDPSAAWRQASIYWCYSLIWFTWLLSRPALPVGKVSCVWWMLLSEMPRSICDAAAKKRGLSYFKSASHVSSSLQSDLASLCNNIQREDNCCVNAHGLALIFKTGHGAAERRPVSLMTVCRRITYTKSDLRWSCTVWRECWETIKSWFEHFNRGANIWLHALCTRAISWYRSTSS